MTYLNAEMQEKLHIYTNKHHQQCTKCLIRGIEIPIHGRPEELVRQMFIHFLIKESELLPNKIYIKVESNNHDIEIYKKPENDNFKPHQTPLMIVEVKREDASLEIHYDQIKRYLTKAGCDMGILYNYRRIIAFVRNNNDDFKNDYIKNLKDIQALILPKINSIDDGSLLFDKAQNGDFDSFLSLIKRYGKYTTNKVVFKLKGQPSNIEGYLFNIQGNKVCYKICGQYSKKYQSFDFEDFEKLISITY